MNCLFLVGPTASGKSEVALRWAQSSQENVIIGCDSVQTYKGLTLGAAMPSLEERALARHELYDFVEEGSELTAGDYRRLCLEVLKKEDLRGTALAIVVGGTGFYFQALEKGMAQAPVVDRVLSQGIRDLCESEAGRKLLYQELSEKDPDALQKIHINDSYRLCRAIEVIRATGKTWTSILREQNQSSFPYALKKYGIIWQKSDLQKRIQERTNKMLVNDGLIDEVKVLNSRGFQNWAPMRSVGYLEAQMFLSGEIKSKAELAEKINISTWQLAKRQMTWFKRDKEIQWLSLEEALKVCPSIV